MPLRSDVSSGRYKPLPQDPPPAAALPSPPPPHTRPEDDERQDRIKSKLTELLEEEDDLELQNRRDRSRGIYSPQTPTIYEEESNSQDPLMKGQDSSMNVNAYENGSDAGSMYGGGMRGVASDFAYGSGTNVNTPAKEGRRGDRTALYVALASLGTFFIGTFAIILSSNPSALGLFAGHPPLQTLAITCFGLGILTLQPTSQPKTKAMGLARHQLVILVVGLPSIIIGTSLIYANKVIHEASHFTTWHGTFGIISIVWMVGQMLLGGLSVWFGGRAFGGGMKAKGVWKYHRVSGYLLFPMFLMTAAVGGNYSSWAASQVNLGVRILVYTLAPIAALVSIWSRARLSKMNFRPS